VSDLRYPDPPLADEHVRLRPGCEADVRPAFEATQDPLILRFTRVPPDQTEDELRQFLCGGEALCAAGTVLSLVIADASTDAFLGTIALMRFSWPDRRGEIGYWVAPSARGRGVATRAVRLLSRWALGDLGLARLALHVHPDNRTSQTVAERAGFTREGVLRSWEERHGERVDTVVFSLLPGEVA
jgi:RimJ/RimL family protein N-acetyltransferase